MTNNITVKKSINADQILGNYLEKRVQDMADEIEYLSKQFAPVRTGYLRDSIQQIKPDENSIIIEATAPYAIFVEFGTRFIAAQSFLRKAFNYVVNKFV